MSKMLDRLINFRAEMADSIFEEIAVGPIDERRIEQAQVRIGEWLPRGGAGIGGCARGRLRKIDRDERGVTLVIGPPWVKARS